jgi:NTE family protein
MALDARTEAPAAARPCQARPAISKTPAAGTQPRQGAAPAKPVGQIVLVLQGGGALGAYQAGVYQGLTEGGIEPDWVIGTSIGAINGALIAGNAAGRRVERLQEFWGRLGNRRGFDTAWSSAFFAGALANLQTLTQGVAGFFAANPHAPWGIHFPVGIERAAFYTTEPLERTLGELVDFDHLNRRQTRLTVGAVNVRSGEMRYFDSRDMALTPAHIMASGALPPGFPAVRIDGEPYWDGGLYSNTPVEVVLDDDPRRDSLIISVNMWQPSGSEPGTIWQVLGRQKDIQYASRGKSHVMRQEQLHRLRHVIRELGTHLSDEERSRPEVRELLRYGCGSTMHLVRLLSPRLDREDHTKDIDFTRTGIRTRWQAGLEHARRVIAEQPWICHVDPLQGVLIHESPDERA